MVCSRELDLFEEEHVSYFSRIVPTLFLSKLCLREGEQNAANPLINRFYFMCAPRSCNRCLFFWPELRYLDFSTRPQVASLDVSPSVFFFLVGGMVPTIARTPSNIREIQTEGYLERPFPCSYPLGCISSSLFKVA